MLIADHRVSTHVLMQFHVCFSLQSAAALAGTGAVAVLAVQQASTAHSAACFSLRQTKLNLSTEAAASSSNSHASAAEVMADSDIMVYQYKICPFCNKLKAIMDYLGIPYSVTEVNPLTKKEIKFSQDYKKVRHSMHCITSTFASAARSRLSCSTYWRRVVLFALGIDIDARCLVIVHMHTGAYSEAGW